MRINTNVAAMNSYNQLKNTNNNMSKSLERLSSGKRINRAADDAAGLAISEKMKGQMNGLAQAQRNAQDGISMTQTAEGALNESQSILQRMRELSVQAANDSNTDADRAEIQKEVDQLAGELTRISNTTEFNTQTLLNGGIEDGKGGDVTFQIGANKGQDMELSVNSMDAKSLGVGGKGIVADVSSATDVNGASVSRANQGNEIKDGATISVSSGTATVQDAKWASGSTGLSGVALTTDSNTSDYNNIQIKTTESTSIVSGASATQSGDTITLEVGSGGASLSDINSALDTTNAGSEAIDASGGTVGLNASGTTGVTQVGLGDSDSVVLEASGSSSEYFTASKDATSHEFGDSSEFAGLSLDLDGSVSTSTTATINLTEESASSAQFDSNGNKTADASAQFGINVSTQEKANEAIATLDEAINKVSQERSKLGAVQNRLDHTINNLSTAEENLTAANSRIRDVDMAKEMMDMSKQRILSQAGTAMLAQANQKSQGVMQLLG